MEMAFFTHAFSFLQVQVLFPFSKIGEQVPFVRKMKDPSLEQQLLSTIDDRDEGVDVCDSTADKIVAASVSPSRRNQLIPGRQSSRLIGRHPITAEVCETIPEESVTGGSLAENDEEERRLRQQIVDAHPPPRRHRKLLPIHHLSLNIRQVIIEALGRVTLQTIMHKRDSANTMHSCAFPVGFNLRSLFIIPFSLSAIR